MKRTPFTLTIATLASASLIGPVAAAAPAAATKAGDRERPAGPPLLGKYGCSESVYTGDGYRSELRGFVTLLAKHRYRQGKGKVGKYAYKGKSGVTRFTGGGLGGSTATAIDGKRNRLFITVKFKHGNTANWACTRVGKS
jgi:hypothetical protein